MRGLPRGLSCRLQDFFTISWMCNQRLSNALLKVQGLQVPLQERIRRDDPGDFLEDSSTQSLRLRGQAPTLIVGEAKAPVAQLLPEHAILLAQVVDCELLLWDHPTAISRNRN